MANIHDARDAGLGGKARFEEWVQEFELTWMDLDPGELVRETLRSQLEMMTEEQRNALRAFDPETYDKIVEKIGGLEDASNIPG